jgi:hypothetical protein
MDGIWSQAMNIATLHIKLFVRFNALCCKANEQWKCSKLIIYT